MAAVRTIATRSALVALTVLLAACGAGGPGGDATSAPAAASPAEAAAPSDASPDGDASGGDGASEDGPVTGVVVMLPPALDAGSITGAGQFADEPLPAEHPFQSLQAFLAVDVDGEAWLGVVGDLDSLDALCMNISLKATATEFPPGAQLTADLGGCPDYERARIQPGDERLATNLDLSRFQPVAFQGLTDIDEYLAIQVWVLEDPEGERIPVERLGSVILSMWVYTEQDGGGAWYAHFGTDAFDVEGVAAIDEALAEASEPGATTDGALPSHEEVVRDLLQFAQDVYLERRVGGSRVGDPEWDFPPDLIDR